MTSKMQSRKDKLLYNLFDYEREETVGEILFFRAFEVVVVYWTLLFAWEWGPYLSRLSDVVLPLGIAEYVDITFMYQNNLGIVNAVIITVMVALGFLRIWRYGYLVALLAFHVHYVARYSQGEISHGSNIIGMTVLAFAVATLAFKHQKEIRRTVLGICYFFFGLGYTSAALCKLVATGPLWPAGRHLHMWIQERTVDTFSLTGTVDYNWLQVLALDYGIIATMILAFGLLVEALGFLFWFKKTRLYIGVLLAGMHIGIMVVMRLDFVSNTLLLFMLAVPLPLLINKALERLEGSTFERLKRRSLKWA